MSDQILPSEGGTLANDQLPIVTDDDVMAILPAYIREADPAPVRDAIVAALRVMATTYQEAASFAAAQRDVVSATGDALDDLLPVRRLEGEKDEDYRLRGLGLRAVVTPAAICAAVNELIAPDVCSYIEPALDQFFLQGAPPSTTWGCFFDVAPQYQDRLFPDDASDNGGVVKPNVNPGAAPLFSNPSDGMFVLYVPDLSQLNGTIVLVYGGVKLNPSDSAVPELGGAIHLEQGNGESLGGTGLFPMSTDGGTNNTARSFIYAKTTSEDRRYDQIVDVVERLRGAGFQWMLLVQPT